MTQKGYLRSVYWRLAGVIMACVVLSLMAVSYFSHRVFERTLVPEVEKKATTVGASVRSLVLKATGYGLTLDSLYGVEQTFDKLVDDNPEFGITIVLSQSLIDPSDLPPHTTTGPLTLVLNPGKQRKILPPSSL